jgi:hypothetical protein
VLTCYMCGETKPEAEFAFADMAKGARQRHCRECQAAYRRAHYLANRDDYIRREVGRIRTYRLENRPLMLAYLRSHPCVDCGESDPVKLEFDHRDPSLKTGYVSVLAAHKPWRLVLVEIAKCDVRCANCHQRRTAGQFNWKKARGSPALLSPVSTPQPWTTAAQSHTADDKPITKVCTGCGMPKPMDEFPIRHKLRGTRGTRCRSCRSAYGKLHYQRKRDHYLARAKARRAGGRGRGSKYWAYLMSHLQSHPCVDCGETDPLVLQFDHRDGTMKVDAVGRMVNRANWSSLLAEIAKCDVRCANCHRLRTAEHARWSKWIRESA